jgi:hypothetical protein
VNGSNTLLRFAVGVVAVVVALRLAVELLEPIAVWLVTAAALVLVVLVARWWQRNRW